VAPPVIRLSRSSTVPRTDLTQARTYHRKDMELIHAYWRAANYLSVGQIYLLDNPLLREPLRAEHVKPRLLGHWGTTPGLNLLYAHMNRVISERDLDALYVTGPGHGGPGLVANAYLEGTYSEVYSSIGQDEDGMRALFRQFSFPGGIPSHVAPGHRRRRTAGAAPQRLQDRQSDRAGQDPRERARGPDARLWLSAVFRHQ
jgi:phosphoketolase